MSNLRRQRRYVFQPSNYAPSYSQGSYGSFAEDAQGVVGLLGTGMQVSSVFTAGRDQKHEERLAATRAQTAALKAQQAQLLADAEGDNTLLYVGGGVLLLVVLGGVVYAATRPKPPPVR